MAISMKEGKKEYMGGFGGKKMKGIHYVILL